MSVGSLPANVSLHLGRPASMRSCDVLLLLGLGLDFGLFFLFLVALGTCLEGNAPLDYGIYVISSEIHIIKY